MAKSPHVPVMLKEVLSLLEGRVLRTVFDGTCGAGGHARAILENHPECEVYVAQDQDPSALLLAQENLLPFAPKVHFSCKNFCFPPEEPPFFDLVLLDIGLSNMQLTTPGRGFSFMHEGPLDMRMSPENPYTAEEIVNSWDPPSLEKLFREKGEERFSRKIADAIVRGRKKKRLVTTKELADLVSSVVPRQGKTHPATKVFQALRIEVNDELGVLERAIPLLASRLAPGGRFLLITFHSLEARVVKQSFRALLQEGPFSLLTKKPLVPTRQEVLQNKKARSALLRAIFCTR